MAKQQHTENPLAPEANAAHSLQRLGTWLTAKEDENLEFKEAKSNFHFDKLVKYCAALDNEGGGSIVLGVTDRMPRRIVGTTAFPDLERTKAGLVVDYACASTPRRSRIRTVACSCSRLLRVRSACPSPSLGPTGCAPARTLCR